MKYVFTKDLATLRPADDSAKQALDAYARGDVVLISFDKGRNPQHHKKFFALLHLAFKNQQKYSSVDLLRHICLIDIGYGEYMTRDNGEVVGFSKSIAFENMGQVAFNDLYEKALVWMSDLVGTDVETLRKEVG